MSEEHHILYPVSFLKVSINKGIKNIVITKIKTGYPLKSLGQDDYVLQYLSEVY